MKTRWENKRCPIKRKRFCFFLKVSPFELTDEVMQHYRKLLDLGGVLAERVKIVVPENSTVLIFFTFCLVFFFIGDGARTGAGGCFGFSFFSFFFVFWGEKKSVSLRTCRWLNLYCIHRDVCPASRILFAGVKPTLVFFFFFFFSDGFCLGGFQLHLLFL